MANRRNITRKSKNTPNSFLIFMVVVVILALISFAISYFVLDQDKEIQKKVAELEEPINPDPIEGQATEVTDQEGLNTMAQLSGTWVSNYDGTMLSIQGNTCVFESPAVDSPEKVSGTIQVNKSIITIVYTGKHSCGSTEGHYEYQKEGEAGVFFKKIKDNCSSRSELMSASWFRL
ncbi:MAG: hypothetical protein A2W85_08730 [Bacteroidetes bacterium GWF2_41_31]|nr:MAG: hypothetical protein A2W85_08730 [Bacteroidetes bacterium GWF2_41_31]